MRDARHDPPHALTNPLHLQMKQYITHRLVRRPTAAIAIGLLVTATVPVVAEEARVARYSTRLAEPTAEQRDPLAALVTLTFPATITTLQQAIERLLEPSGYRLAPASVSAPERAQLLALPLPESQRTLGPLPVRRALTTVVPPGYALIEDPVHRLVSFDRCSALSLAR